MGTRQEMEVDHDDVVAIVVQSKTRLRNNGMYKYSGTSIDLYKFKNKQAGGWKHGEIFRANRMEDLSFKDGIRGDISALRSINRRAACFLVHAPDKQESVQDMIVRSSKLKHEGVLKPYIAGFNTQISQVVSGYSDTTSSLFDWLRKKPVKVGSIPVEVQQLIRTGYMAIELIWKEGSTSDHLEDIRSYDMIDSNVKINPSYIRRKRADDKDEMVPRRAFGRMILGNIHSIWRDDELLDFIDILGNPRAREKNDVLEHPVLLMPARREVLYHKFDRAILSNDQKNWLANNADPGVLWKTEAGNYDPALKEILSFQVEQEKQRLAAAGQPDEVVQQAMGFSVDFSGALHFASVTTSHYLKFYKAKETGNWREGIKGRVDFLLKKVLPRLLSRCYNAKFVVVGAVALDGQD